MKYLAVSVIFLLGAAHVMAQQTTEMHLRMLANTPTEVVLRFELSGILTQRVTTSRGEAVVPHFQGSTPLLRKGAPDVPKYSTAVRISPTGNWEVSVVAGDYEDMEGVEVAPSKGNLLRTERPAAVPYEYGSAYAEDAFFPGVLAEAQSPFVFRDARGQALWLYPVQYNPVRRVLRVYRALTVSLKRREASGLNELAQVPASSAFSQAFAALQDRLFVNGAPPAVTDRGGTELPEQMLIVTPAAFLPEVEPLVAWKRQRGIATEVVATDELGSRSADAVYAFVRQYYFQHGLTYLLLVGDEEAIAPLTLPYGDQRYACDNCFGYLVGDDHLPEVLVGRLHAATTEQARLMVRRMLEYEKTPLLDPQADWMSAGMAVASDEGEGYGDDGQADWQHGNEWKANHLADGYTWYWEFYDGSHGPQSPTPGHITADKNGEPLPNDLAKAICQRGVSLFNYTGHGWEQGLATGNFNTDIVRTLDNAGRYPILIAVACSPGDFTGPKECLGEAWQRLGNYTTGQPYGGIAGFFSSVLQSWVPPMEAQDGMNQYLVDADGIALHPTVGAMAAYGYARMIAAYAHDGEQMADFWNPFADPSTVPRTRFPQTIAAQHLDTLAFGATSMTIACPVEGALATLCTSEELITFGRVKNGIAQLAFQPLTVAGPLTLTLTQFNRLPYQKPVYVHLADQPHVVASMTLADDNGNGRLEYAEGGTLRAVFRNLGTGTAQPITASVRTPAALLHRLDTAVVVPALAAGDTLERLFRFVVRPDVPHGARAEFTLTLSGNGQPESSVSTYALLHAPQLEVVGWALSSVAGYASRRIESGEVARLYVQVRNRGGSASPAGTVQCHTHHADLVASIPATLSPIPEGGVGTVALDLSASSSVLPSTWVFPEVALSAGYFSCQTAVGPFVVNPIVETFETGNFQRFAWERSGNRLWHVSAQTPHEGKLCARASGLGVQQNATLALPLLVSASGWVSFAYRLSATHASDTLYFLIDGVPVGRWGGGSSETWREVLLPVTAGSHVLAWTFRRGASEGGNAAAFLDEIILPAHKSATSTLEAERAPTRLLVWPNPATDDLWLQFDLSDEQPLRAEVWDGLGRLMHEQPLTALDRQPINVSRLAPGVYWVRVRSARGEAVGRFVKR